MSVGLFLSTGKCFFERLCLKANGETLDSFKIILLNFGNGTLCETSPFFYITIVRDFEHVRCSNFEVSFLKNDILFKKLKYRFLVESTTIKSATFPKNWTVKSQCLEK